MSFARRGASQGEGTKRRTANIERRNAEHWTTANRRRRSLSCPFPGKPSRTLRVRRKNPRDPNAAPKYYALDMTRSLLDEEDAAHAIAVRSGLSGSILDLRLSICD